MIPSIRSDLYEAFKQPGCPVCQVVVQSVSHYIRSVFYEKINDRELRADLRESRGFCVRHAWQTLQPGLGDALGGAILYQDILTDILREFPEAAPVEGQSNLSGQNRWLAGLVKTGQKERVGRAKKVEDAVRPKKLCPVCQQREELHEIVLAELLEGLAEESMQVPYRDSFGLCLPHLSKAVAIVEDAGLQGELIQVSRSKMEGLRSELGEFIRKNDYRFTGEAFGPERDAWARAVRLVAGELEAWG